MKKNLTLLLLLALSLIYSLSYAQAPNGINYQAVIRNSTGTLQSNKAMAIRVNIKQNSPNGPVVFSERQNVTSDQFGLVNFVIGNGTFLGGGPFANINWANGPFYLDLGVAFSGLPSPIIYMPYGTQQMMSVPYALYAKSSGNLVNQWKYGAGVPASNLGLVGDYYLDTATGNVYTKTNGTTWVLISNIMGPQGVAGAVGPQGNTGSTGLTGPQGLQGIQGVAGPAGPAGTAVLNGITNPVAGTGVNGDFYINTATNELFGPKANGIWPTGVSLVGPQGIQGLAGPTGATGLTGPQGPSGTNGSNGLNAVTLTTVEPAGANCATGGVKLEFGPDVNGNGLLDVGEIVPALTQFVCNGAIGATGVAGPQGIQGVAGTNGLNALIKTTVEPAGAYCATGGTKIETGLDSNNNGVLDAGEVVAAQTTYVCNGAGGAIPYGNAQGQMLYWNGSAWVHVAPGITGQTLTFCYNAPQWGPCLPQVTTLPVTNITGYTAASGVNITATGGNAVTTAGICWSINPNPTLNDSVNPNGSVSGTTNLNLTNLSPGTTYYVRAFATNAGGTAYGNQLTLVTGAALPTITTSSATNISFNSAIVGGNVSNDGGAPVTTRGVCWSTTQNPTLANNSLIIGSGLGAFNDTITGLSGNTTYYLRAFATNSSGTAYGNQISFTTFTAPAAQNCSGWGSPNAVSSLMNAQGFITANVGQIVDISMTTNYAFITCCNGPNHDCPASKILTPPNTNILSYNCGGQVISSNLSFNSPGTYNITIRAGSGNYRTCIVSIYVH